MLRGHVNLVVNFCKRQLAADARDQLKLFTDALNEVFLTERVIPEVDIEPVLEDASPQVARFGDRISK